MNVAVSNFFMAMMPNIIIATAAIGIFVALGIFILGAILLERWYIHHGRPLVHRLWEAKARPLTISRGLSLKIKNSVAATRLRASGKLSSNANLGMMAGRHV